MLHMQGAEWLSCNLAGMLHLFDSLQEVNDSLSLGAM